MDLDQYYSRIEGKAILTRISPDFVAEGGEWKPGLPLAVPLDETRGDAKQALASRYPNKKWKLKSLSITTYGQPGRQWYVVMRFESDTSDSATMLANMKGALWPIGKNYDEFK